MLDGSGCGSPPSGLPAISPSRGEIDPWLPLGHLLRRDEARSCAQLISPPEGEMSGRTEGGKPHPPTSLTRPPITTL
ncbi:hypothetical protein DXM21_08850 [Agrobacterium rosae]|nr:hypothetical protein DXM21_08850 [Agrobacterium rosae]KAA3521690.1 hypothetical protein DXM25_09130 [Agrobacterium rosae]MQB48319.1 hypothetical protein [Agrobacterium rosae]